VQAYESVPKEKNGEKQLRSSVIEEITFREIIKALEAIGFMQIDKRSIFKYFLNSGFELNFDEKEYRLVNQHYTRYIDDLCNELIAMGHVKFDGKLYELTNSGKKVLRWVEIEKRNGTFEKLIEKNF